MTVDEAARELDDRLMIVCNHDRTKEEYVKDAAYMLAEAVVKAIVLDVCPPGRDSTHCGDLGSTASCDTCWHDYLTARRAK